MQEYFSKLVDVISGVYKYARNKQYRITCEFAQRRFASRTMSQRRRVNNYDGTAFAQRIEALPKWLRTIVLGGLVLILIFVCVLYVAMLLCMLLTCSGALWLCLNGLTCSKYSACFDAPIIPFWFVFVCVTVTLLK